MTSPVSCPACRGQGLAPVVDLGQLPVLANELWETPEEARRAPRGPIRLVVCTACGLVFNADFDPDLVHYSSGYENALHHSATFREYADELARRLIERYDLKDSTIVEVGSGSGHFLALLCELGGNRGIGYDPSHDPGRRPASDRIEVIPQPFPVGETLDADLVTCQHVLEHVTDPRGLLEGLASALDAQRGTVLYLEVPDAGDMFARTRLWEIIYEHYTYFSAPTLDRLLSAAGLAAVDTGTSFGGQYLWAEARQGGAPPARRDDVDGVVASATSFGARVQSHLDSWGRQAADLSANGGLAVWGAGSKGVSFLNLLQDVARPRWVVDVNPAKQGRYVPGTGHRVASPADLQEEPPSHVLLMNGLYRDEVKHTLNGLGLQPTVVVL